MSLVQFRIKGNVAFIRDIANKHVFLNSKLTSSGHSTGACTVPSLHSLVVSKSNLDVYDIIAEYERDFRLWNHNDELFSV